jgi:hypothetical protein
VDDLPDQFKRVLAALAKPDQRNIRMLARGHRRHIAHIDGSRYDLVPEAHHHPRHVIEAVTTLIRDQHAKMLMLRSLLHPNGSNPRKRQSCGKHVVRPVSGVAQRVAPRARPHS